MLSGLRDAATAKRLCRKALPDPSHSQPRVINTDQARLYGAANDLRIETIYMIREGQAQRVSGSDVQNRLSSSTICSKWLHETELGRLDPSFSGRFLKVATHPLSVLLHVARSRSAPAAATGKTSSGSSWIVTLGHTARAISHRWR